MFRTTTSLAACAIIFCSVSAAHADPFTFQFLYPAWDSNSNAALYGNSPIVQITVDNGSTTDVNQLFDFSTDVVSVDVSTDTGTYVNSWTNADLSIVAGLDFDYLSTDANGEAVLDLATMRASRTVFSNTSGTWQFGTRAGFTQSWLNDGASFGGPDTALHSTTQGFTVNTVPEPSGVLAIGLAAFGICLRRRRGK